MSWVNDLPLLGAKPEPDSSREREFFPAMRSGQVDPRLFTIHNMPRCRVKRTTAQSMNNGENTVVFDATAEYDTEGMFDGTSKIIIQTPGLYDVKAHMRWVYAAGGAYRAAWVLKNELTTGTRYGVDAGFPTAVNADVWNTVALTMALNRGDYIVLSGYQDIGAPLNINTGSGQPAAEIDVVLASTI